MNICNSGGKMAAANSKALPATDDGVALYVGCVVPVYDEDTDVSNDVTVAAATDISAGSTSQRTFITNFTVHMYTLSYV